MDEIEVLRRVRADQAEPSSSAVAAGRDALLERAARGAGNTVERRGTSKKLRRGWSLVAAATVGAVATAVIVAGGFTNGSGPVGAPPVAAAVLQEAAEAAISVSDPVLEPGQYLRIETVGINSGSSIVDDTTPVAWLESSRDTLYVPYDRQDDWVWDRGPGTVVEVFGPEAEAFLLEMEQYKTADVGGPGELLRAPGGAFYGSPPQHEVYDYASLPREPQELLDHIYSVTEGHGPSRDGEALVFIADILRPGTVPAEIRSALYGAAALIPGITVVEEQATLAGKTGVAIGRVEAGVERRQEIIIDPATGALIGERQVQLTDDFGVPAGTDVSSSSVTTSVVDSAPEGGTPNGDYDLQGCEVVGVGQIQCPEQE